MNTIKAAHRAGRPLWISRQVLREFIAARTRPQTFAQPSLAGQVIERVRYLKERFQVAVDTSAVTNQLVKLIGDFQIGGRPVHDANIVAAMLAYGVHSLLTHNTSDFRPSDTIIEIVGINP